MTTSQLIAALGWTHIQLMPAATWSIEHDLGVDPAGVLVFDADGSTVLEGAGITYTVPGYVLELSFDIPVVGTAHLS